MRLRIAFVVVLAFVAVLIVGTPAQAHKIKGIKPSVCQRDWQTTAGNESQIRCMANYFGVNADYAASVAKCESGFRYNATSPSGTYRGTWQMGPMFESNRAHMIPAWPYASPYQGRYATIFVMRYTLHFGWSAWACS